LEASTRLAGRPFPAVEAGTRPAVGALRGLKSPSRLAAKAWARLTSRPRRAEIPLGRAMSRPQPAVGVTRRLKTRSRPVVKALTRLKMDPRRVGWAFLLLRAFVCRSWRWGSRRLQPAHLGSPRLEPRARRRCGLWTTHPSSRARAAASRAMGTRYGEHET
jgi:hypothetical protein